MTRTSEKTSRHPVYQRGLLAAGLVTLSVVTGTETLDEGTYIASEMSRSTDLDTGVLPSENPPIESPSSPGCVAATTSPSSETRDTEEDTEEEGIVTTSANAYVMKQLDRYRDLEQGWNGYDAPPIPDDVIDLAKEVAKRPEVTSRGPEVFPTGRGTIQFEFLDQQGDEAELEIFSREDSILLVIPEEGEVLERRTRLYDSIAILDGVLA